MSRASVWLVRVALAHLLAGAALGAWMLAAKAGGPPSPVWAFPVHVEVLLYGWLLQLVLGVAHWILPRPAGEGRARDTFLLWTAAVALNAGVWLIVAAAVLGGPLELPGRGLELTAAVLAASHLAPRLRTYRSPG